MIDDRLLYLGLKKFGGQELEKTIQFFLPGKNISEIKNRYKNVIRKKAPANILKTWKALEYAPLTELEKMNL